VLYSLQLTHLKVVQIIPQCHSILFRASQSRYISPSQCRWPSWRHVAGMPKRRTAGMPSCLCNQGVKGNFHAQLRRTPGVSHLNGQVELVETWEYSMVKNLRQVMDERESKAALQLVLRSCLRWNLSALSMTDITGHFYLRLSKNKLRSFILAFTACRVRS
jgi:hypothetical protein